MDAMFLNTPGSIGGGIALPGRGVGNDEAETDIGEKTLFVDGSGGSGLPREAYPLSLVLRGGGDCGGKPVGLRLRSSFEMVPGSRFKSTNDSSNSVGSCNQGPCNAFGLRIHHEEGITHMI